MSTTTATETTREPRINETAPDFTAETTEGLFAFTNGSATAGQSCFRIRRTSLQCAPLSWERWPGFNPSSPSETPRSSA